MSWARLCVCLLCCAWLLACDAVGRAVVGEHVPGGITDLCPKQLACASLDLDPPGAVPELIEPIDLAQCTRAAAALCAAGAVSGGAAQCGETSRDLKLSFAEAQASDALHEVNCHSVKLTHVAEDGPSALQLGLAAWDDMRIEVESDQPIVVEVSGGHLERVSFELNGPVTLRLLDVGDGNDVRVLGAGGASHVELVRTTLAKVVLSVPEGDVLLRRSALQNVVLWAQRVEVESALIRDAIWHTASLNAADATLVRVRSEAQRSVLSSCDVETTSFLGCQSFSAIDGKYRHVKLSACAEEAAVYGSDVMYAQIEGDLILDRASLYNSVLGVGEVGSIEAWDAKLAYISFCADQQALALGGASEALCAHCDVAPEPVEPDACLLDNAMLRATKSESCPKLDQPPICGDPQPKRMRPPLH